ncbi:hypothetical protein IFM89_000832 [Coptis chinensis]|uniref:Zn-cluster domain-containing protein n=1 Tax=Coptis chinensis TaxID=261450 RepID=A0A835IUF2_9MAGN|nr:hypothetical protein IFM89_000832 [Coptis chinensis]
MSRFHMTGLRESLFRCEQSPNPILGRKWYVPLILRKLRVKRSIKVPTISNKVADIPPNEYPWGSTVRSQSRALHTLGLTTQCTPPSPLSFILLANEI